MADAITLEAQPRDPQKNKGTGSRASKKLRAAGRIPAIIYGHKQPNVPITLSRDDVWSLLKKSAHLANLRIDGSTETVLVREIQWDHLGKEIIHLDFARVDAQEMIETEVRVDLRGVAPGVAEGGVLEHLAHNIEVVCRADAIPDALKVDISGLHLNGAIHARDLALPEGVKLASDPESLIVHIISRAAEAEPTPAEGAVTQPEVIKRPEKPKEE